MNRNQFEINTETRRLVIINHIINHQRCTRADLERGLINRMSKKTISKVIKILTAENIIQEDKQSGKNRKLYVSENNLLVSVPRELERFESAFISMFDKTTENIVAPSLFGEYSGDVSDTSNGDLTLNSISKRISQLSEERLSLLFRMVDSILIRSVMIWPKRIQDKEALKKLYHIVFAKIGGMLVDIEKNHEIPPCMDYSMQKLAIKKLRGGGSLFEYWRKFKNYGMGQEIDYVIDSLWNAEKEIQEIAYKDLEYASTKIGFSFKYGSDNWRELFERLDSLDSQKAQ